MDEHRRSRRRVAMLAGHVAMLPLRGASVVVADAAGAGVTPTFTTSSTSSASNLLCRQPTSASGGVAGVVVAPEVAAALAAGRAVVALESTIVSHGMPYPQNLAMAREAGPYTFFYFFFSSTLRRLSQNPGTR